MYCSYCGYGYIKRKCKLCGHTISTCGCDSGRDVREEHYCVCCDEPFLELNEWGECKQCKEATRETEQYHANDILGFG